MSSPNNENEEPSSTSAANDNGEDGGESVGTAGQRPPAKRRLSSTVIEISDTESDDSDVCAVNSYQASADEVKRIRGADYSSSSSSSDYSSDSESPWEDDSILLEDDKTESKLVRSQLNPRANRMDDPKLNPGIKSQEVIDRLSSHWKEFKDHTSDDVTLTCEPFRVCLLHNMLSNPEIINNIVDDMNTLDWSRKKMDLYEFHQTADLASLTWQRSIRGIYELLKTEIMSWVSQVTGLELRTVSASCSLYGPGDHLLVHDDMLGDRRVAFILYLAPWHPTDASTHKISTFMENGAGDIEHVKESCAGWRPSMGGALELFARDAAGRPSRVQRSIYPQNNMLAFFKVGCDSFHQVSEVLSLELPRLSINGWFHGPAPPDEEPPPTPPPPPIPVLIKPHNDVVLLNEWVCGAYMSPRARAQIQAQMERCSEVCLRSVLLPDKYRQLLAALSHHEVPWEAAGPADVARGWRLPGAWAAARPAGHALRGLAALLTSAAFCRMLTDCTDLTLTAYENLELQRWTPGDYTLVPPREQYQRARLEAVLYAGVPERPICGGATVYLAPEEPSAHAERAGRAERAEPADAALVTVPPTNNALSLVYCDSGAASFTKYLSRMTMREGDYFYIITCTYRE